MRLTLVSLLLFIAVSAPACANPGLGSSVGLKASVRPDAVSGPFKAPPILRERVDFWKDIFTKYGAGHSVIHHRDFPQIVFGVVDLSREREAMSPTAFDAYKSAVVNRTVSDLKVQMLELAQGAEARTPFQERVTGELERRNLRPWVLKSWIDEDLIRTQTGIRERYAEAIRRSWRYLPVMEQIFVAEYGLPKELTRIPFIESSFDYTAYSSVGAAGIWQFMPKTARVHRMLVGRSVDERRDPVKATRGAAEYLRSAYNSLGSWPLAITSYNHGVGGVRSKVRKAGTDDLARIIEDPSERYFGFASTNFYPEFLAAVEIFEEHDLHFPEVPEEPPLRVASYYMQRSMSAPQTAARLGIPLEDLKEANYGLMETVWRGRASIPAGYTLRVPIGFKQRADSVFGAGRTEPVMESSRPGQGQPRQVQIARRNTQEQRVPAQDEVFTISSAEAAALFNEGRVAPAEQQSVSRGSASARRSSQMQNTAYRVTPNSTKSKKKNSAVKYYTVRSGDTLGSIAKKQNVRMERLRQVNNLKGSKVLVGQRLLIPQQ
jgi:membrane-bound lytic murein transglycosylase D